LWVRPYVGMMDIHSVSNFHLCLSRIGTVYKSLS